MVEVRLTAKSQLIEMGFHHASKIPISWTYRHTADTSRSLFLALCSKPKHLQLVSLNTREKLEGESIINFCAITDSGVPGGTSLGV